MIALLLLAFSSAQECPDLANRVLSLPGFNAATGEFPCFYSGLIDVDEQSQMFYAMTANKDSDKPLVFWFPGGPGGSGLGTLFVENGPLKVIQRAQLEVDYIDTAWDQVAHIVYMDSPLDAGFSKTDREKKVETHKQAAEDFV